MNSRLIQSAIRHLKAQGIVFEAGLSDTELSKVEEICNCRLPPDLRQFLQTALPVSGGFPNWRSESEVVLRRLLDRPWEGIKFDIEHNGFWDDAWGSRPLESTDAITEAQQCFADVPILIPIRSKHYLPAFPVAEDNPIFSVRQSDISISNSNLTCNLTCNLTDFPQDAQAIRNSRSIPFWSAVAQVSRIKVPNLSADHVGHPDEYEDLRKAVESAGYWAQTSTGVKYYWNWAETSTVVTFDRHEPSGNRRDGRFWITKRTFGWLLVIRCPRLFYAPQSHRITELCLALLARLPEDPRLEHRLAYWDFHLDDGIRREFDLVAFKPHTEQDDDREARLRSVEKRGWREMSHGQENDVWSRFQERFGYPNGRTFQTPASATTWDVSIAYLRGTDVLNELESDLAQKTLAAFQECVEPHEEIFALDWNHPCYYLDPHGGMSGAPLSSWAVPILPNGDHYIYLAQDFRFGIVGNCVDQTICVFGQRLLDALSRRTPLIFKRPTWSFEQRREYESEWERAGWVQLLQEERHDRWEEFGERFQFFERRNHPGGPIIEEPSPSLTWDISAAFSAAATVREQLEANLTRCVLAAMCKVVRPGEQFYSFDSVRWNERYSFSPHRLTSVRRDAWALPVFPDEKFSIFVTSNMKCGLFGDPLDQTICVFGQDFLGAIVADPPDLLGNPIRKDGHSLP